MRTKTLSFILASSLTLLVAFAGVGLVAASMYQTITMEVTNGAGETIEAELPLNPKKIVCLNYDSIDILDRLGMGDRIVGMIKGESTPKHLKKYDEDPSIVDLGSMKEPNMQALAELKPHIILSSGRTAKLYDELTKIAPTMMVSVDAKDGFFKGVKSIAVKHGTFLGKEKDIQKYLENIEQKMERIRQKNDGRTAIQAIFVGENLHILGGKPAEGKPSAKVLIADLGFDNTAEDFDRANTETSSYDYILEKNPEFIFVLDKNTAINSEAAKAKDVLPTQEKLMQTAAFKEGKLIFLSPESTWYLNNGGLTAMETMITNFASLPKKSAEGDNKEDKAKQERSERRQEGSERGENRGERSERGERGENRGERVGRNG